MYSPISAELVGLPPATLQTWLTQAQTALHALNTGALEIDVEYAQGDGTRKVMYNRASMANLRAYIRQLQVALNPHGHNNGRRRAIRLRF